VWVFGIIQTQSGLFSGRHSWEFLVPIRDRETWLTSPKLLILAGVIHECGSEFATPDSGSS